MRPFLLVIGIFIIAVGLFYGAPKAIIENAFDVTIDNNALHLLRATMGLYCAIGIFVLIGVKKRTYANFSLQLSCLFFGGVGIGRLVSFFIDGHITRVSGFATAFEIIVFIMCLIILASTGNPSKNEPG